MKSQSFEPPWEDAGPINPYEVPLDVDKWFRNIEWRERYQQSSRFNDTQGNPQQEEK